MFPRLQHALLPLALALPATLYAGDYTYQQTTQLTGGALLHMMKTVGIFSSQARHIGDPVVSTIYLKDNRLANVSPDNIQIIDLDKETITQIDVQKKTYTVMTFEQMKQAIEDARAQLQQQPATPAAGATRAQSRCAERQDELRRQGPQHRRTKGNQWPLKAANPSSR